MQARIFITAIVIAYLLGVSSCGSKEKSDNGAGDEPDSPRIVNIINFIRQCEPRIDWITEDVLYETVVSQVEILKKYNLKGTFLLQYDALIDPRYQELMKSLPADRFEIGAWWEIPQPLVEHSGMVWRGRYPWDWHADVGFATGYTPDEREKLADTYMHAFDSIFGYYPQSVGSWFIDAHTLNYMYEKYRIVASCNCKDQIGTDGYTMWGGYWNQGYYPSKKNAYMPAQNQENQIPVPIFRMLGSDPIYQYDNGLGTNVQRVVSLEPVYTGGGGNEEWCNWYFSNFVEGEALAYGYVQVGQENSFTWKRMQKGFEIQMPIIDSLLKDGRIVVQTLGETGAWFKEKYPVTPPTSVTVLNDHTTNNLKTVWFNSRFYRANLLWDHGSLRFRDIHLFDEQVESDYLYEKGTSTACNYYTLPVVDGFQWSDKEFIAGLRFEGIEGEVVEVVKVERSEIPIAKRIGMVKEGELRVRCETMERGEIEILFSEEGIRIKGQGRAMKDWYLELTWAPGKEIPLVSAENNILKYSYLDHEYEIGVIGVIEVIGGNEGIRVRPVRGRMAFEFQ